MKATGDIPKDAKPGDIRNIVDANGKQRFPDYGTWAQQFDRTKEALRTNLAFHESKLGGAGFRYRSQHQSIQTLLENIGIIGYDGWKIMVIDNGVVATGKVKGMELLKEFELRASGRKKRKPMARRCQLTKTAAHCCRRSRNYPDNKLGG